MTSPKNSPMGFYGGQNPVCGRHGIPFGNSVCHVSHRIPKWDFMAATYGVLTAVKSHWGILCARHVHTGVPNGILWRPKTRFGRHKIPCGNSVCTYVHTKIRKCRFLQSMGTLCASGGPRVSIRRPRVHVVIFMENQLPPDARNLEWE